MATKTNYVHKALTHILAVFTHGAVVLAGERQERIPAGTVYALCKVELEPPGKTKAGARWVKVPKGTLRLTLANKATDLLVKATDVQISMGRIPDWRLELFLVKHGYQAQTYVGIQCETVRCRDFGGEAPIAKQCAALSKQADNFLDGFLKTF